jgi:hypothetical protein
MSRTHKYVAMQAYRGFQRPGGIGGQGTLGPKPPPWSKGGRKFPPQGVPDSWVAFSGDFNGMGSRSYHADNLVKVGGNTRTWIGTANPPTGNDFTYKMFWGPSPVTTDKTLGQNGQTAHNTYGESCVLPSGNVLKVRNTVGQTHKFDEVADAWVAQTAPVGHDGSVCLCSGGGFVANKDAFIFGGDDRGTGNLRTHAYAFNESLGTWSSIAPLPVGNEDGSAIPLYYGSHAGQILVGGGGLGVNFSRQLKWWFYDPVLDTYTPTTDSTAATFFHEPIGVFQLTNGLVYSYGGKTSENGPLTNMENTFDPETETWARHRTGGLPFAVGGDTGSSAYMSDGTIVLCRNAGSYYGAFA